MAEFYLEKTAQSAGEHLVHFDNCTAMPKRQEMIYLGSIASFESAWKSGKSYYNAISACPTCASKYATA